LYYGYYSCVKLLIIILIEMLKIFTLFNKTCGYSFTHTGMGTVGKGLDRQNLWVLYPLTSLATGHPFSVLLPILHRSSFSSMHVHTLLPLRLPLICLLLEAVCRCRRICRRRRSSRASRLSVIRLAPCCRLSLA
jgi:hypothetical protein